MADISKIEGYNLKDIEARLSIEQIYNYIRFPYISNIDKVPYLFRKSGGSLSVGDWEEDKLVGGSVAFNQLIQDGDFPDGTESSWSATGCTIAFSDNKCTVTAYSSVAAASNIRQNVLVGKENHIIFASQTITSSKAVGGGFYIGENYTAAISVPANKKTVVEDIQKTKSSYSNTQLYFCFNKNGTLSQGDTLTIENAFAIDLTQMFGEEVAEYFNALETEERGKGVKAFRSLFPNVYYAYNTGEIVSVKTSAHRAIGFNQFNKNASDVSLGYYMEESGTLKSATTSNITGYIKVVGNTQYCFTKEYATYVTRYGAWYDVSKNLISTFHIENNAYLVRTSPSNAYYVRTTVGVALWDNFCINISDTSKNGTYEPYEEFIYLLDSNLELRGSIKLNTTTNTLYNDGDTYDSDGNVVRKCGYIEFDGSSDEDWSYASGNKWATITISDMMSGANQNGITNWLPQSTTYGTYGFALGRSNNNFYAYQVPDISGVTDAESWKTYLSTHPLQVRYPLATPTTETATPFTNPQRVFNNGTEEYIDSRTIAMPVGHETKYQAHI